MLPAAERLAAAPALPPTTGPLALAEAVVRLLDAIEPRPVIVLDDLQRADPDTLALLVHVAGSRAGHCSWCCIAASARRRVADGRGASRDQARPRLRLHAAARPPARRGRGAGRARRGPPRRAERARGDSRDQPREPVLPAGLGRNTEDGPDAPDGGRRPRSGALVGVWLSAWSPTRERCSRMPRCSAEGSVRRDRGPDPARRGAACWTRSTRRSPRSCCARWEATATTSASHSCVTSSTTGGAQPPRARAPPARRAARAQRDAAEVARSITLRPHCPARTRVCRSRWRRRSARTPRAPWSC